jgi:hypothetical protein
MAQVMVTGEAEKMITFTQLTPAALDEAAAIVEAEWMRLQRQSAARVEDHFAEPTESPAPHMCTPGPPPVKGMSSQLISKETRLEVWATERAPPVG